MSAQIYRLRIVGDDSFVAALKREPDITIESESPAKDATVLGFDLGTIAAVVALVHGSFYVGELGIKLLDALSESRANKVVLQGPFGTLELVKDNPVSRDELRTFLHAAQKLSQ